MKDKLMSMKQTSVLNKIRFEESDQNKVFNKISSQGLKPSRWYIGFLGVAVCLGVLVFALFQVVPSNLFQNNNNSADPVNGDVKTIQIYLRKVFTGPSDELKKALAFSEDGPTLDEYFAENYKDLISESSYKTFVNTNEMIWWLQPASFTDYQLKPTKIEIQKVENVKADAYTFKVKVEYSKDGKSNSAIVTGYINMNDKGKITTIRDVNDKDLREALTPPPPKRQ